MNPCTCRDCMEIQAGNPGELCWECDLAGCKPSGECQRDDAYSN